jgi:hypothetical protein
MEKTLQSVTVDGMRYSLIQVWDDEPGCSIDLVGVEVSSGLRRVDVTGDTRNGRKEFYTFGPAFDNNEDQIIAAFRPSLRKTAKRLLNAPSF